MFRPTLLHMTAIKTLHSLGAFRATAAGLAFIAMLLIIGIAALPQASTVAHADGRDAHPHAGAQDSAASPAEPEHKIQLQQGEIFELDLPAEPGTGFVLTTALAEIDNGSPITIELWPHSNRAATFRVRTQQDDGSLVEVEAGPERTMRGRIVEVPGSVVAATLLGDGLHSVLLVPDMSNALWIEPLSLHVPDAEPGMHIAYLSSDPGCAVGVCGITDELVNAAESLPSQEQSQGGLAGEEQCETVNIAIDIDFPFVQIWGGETGALNRVESVMNNLNAIYEDNVAIIHLITEIIVRTSSASNPYNCTSGSGSAGNLLDAFQNVWTSFPESQIERDVAHLFTGCTGISADGIAQLGGANVSGNFFVGVCRPNHYGLSTHQTFLSCQTHVASHELGHNWSAQHCDGTSGCSGSIMPAFFPPCSSFFSGFSGNQILNHKNHSTFGACTEECNFAPANDDCASGLNVSEGDTPFSNIGATTDGPTEPICDFSNNSGIQADVWFRHTAQCTGTLHVELCKTNPAYDSKLAVYPINCPTAPGTALACNKDACGHLSAVDVPVLQGNVYRIRIGGHNGAQGEGILSISCTPAEEPCPGDLTDDGSVGVPDLLELLAAWGPCDGCAADLNDDDTVGVPDLLELLAAWGACP